MYVWADMGLLVGIKQKRRGVATVKFAQEIAGVESGLQTGERFTVYRVDDLFKDAYG